MEPLKEHSSLYEVYEIEHYQLKQTFMPNSIDFFEKDRMRLYFIVLYLHELLRTQVSTFQSKMDAFVTPSKT